MQLDEGHIAGNELANAGTLAVSRAMRRHYAATFARHGATARGVDWGAPRDVALRYEKMLAVVETDVRTAGPPSLLDVGCGYGGLLEHAQRAGRSLIYTGIELVTEMVEHARRAHPGATFVCGDALELPASPQHDYVVCSGVLTQRLQTGIRDMDRFAQRLIRQLFALCRRGAAFNVMTTAVNYMVDNLYYRSPVDLLAWCLAELTDRVRLDHAYGLYEYTLYLYHPASEGSP